jgi:hypothetical protein
VSTDCDKDDQMNLAIISWQLRSESRTSSHSLCQKTNLEGKARTVDKQCLLEMVEAHED